MTLTDPKKKLETCDPRIIKLVKQLATQMDILVVCGHRTKEEQNDAFKRGNSKLKWPKSGHNNWPSKAVDLAPYPDGKLDWNNTAGFESMQEKAREIAAILKIELKPVISWDKPHLELK